MKRVLLLGCLIAGLAACGGRGDRVEQTETRGGPLGGVSSFLQNAFASQSAGPSSLSAVEGGGLCGDPLLVGEPIGSVAGPGVCGIKNAVSLRQVGNIRLTQAASIDCTTARALRQWVETGAVPAIGNRGGGIDSLKVAAHYACRTRNHRRGAKISEHGKGKAIDISAIRLKDGTEITLLEGWNSKRDGAALRTMWRAACGPFGTVLGPESDRFHRDHFHFDTASYRSGSYCR